MFIWERLWWYLENIFSYALQMLPCMLAALICFFLVSPLRRELLDKRGLVSAQRREYALLLFTMFCAGLAALTLFPANLWSHVINWIRIPEARAQGLDLFGFYPTWDAVLAETDYRNLFTPFQEIRRGLYGGPWVFFMLLGNIGMFVPVGFFTALLWRRPRWWKSLVVGLLSSATIEFVQFFIGRSTDIDDVILNTAGALLGFWLFWLINLVFPGFMAGFHCYERKGPDHGLFG